MFRHIGLSKAVLQNVYQRTILDNPKIKHSATQQDRRLQMDVEIWLWQHNDLRTQAATTAEFLRLDNCKMQIDLPVWHVSADSDQYFDHHLIEQHLRIIFKEVNIAHSKITNHTSNVVADEKEVMGLIPPELRRVMRQL
jgi:hypothetical protein